MGFEFESIPNGVLSGDVLATDVANAGAATSAVLDKVTALESAALDELGLMAEHLTKILNLQQEYGLQTIQTAIALLRLAKDDPLGSYRIASKAVETILRNPIDFGGPFLSSFLGFYLQDLINIAKLIYESALLVACLNECLAPSVNFVPAAEAVLEVSRYLEVAKVVGPGQACQPIHQIAEELDQIIDKASRFLDENGSILRLADKSAVVVEETLDFMITLSRALPAMIQGPLKEYAEKLADDPAQLGRMYGIAAAVVIGFAFPIEEVLVLATGLKVMRPIVVVGGIVGGLLPGEETDDAPPQLEPRIVHAAPVTPQAVEKVFAGIGTLTEQELGLIRWLMIAFDEARAARRLEERGHDAEEVARAMHANLNLADMQQYGFKSVNRASMSAAADLSQQLRGCSGLLAKLRPVVKDVIVQARYQLATYNALSRRLRILNSNLERLYYLTQGVNLSSVERIDFLRKTAQLQGSLFETAHIIDKKFIDASRTGWKSFEDFLAVRPRWFSGGQPRPGKMPCIALRATDHRVNSLGIPDVWGVAANTVREETVTFEMERMFTTTSASPTELAEAIKRGALVVGPETRAIDIVKLQRKIYEQYFADVFERVKPEIDAIIQALEALPP